jgi:hypothetical protein
MIGELWTFLPGFEKVGNWRTQFFMNTEDGPTWFVQQAMEIQYTACSQRRCRNQRDFPAEGVPALVSSCVREIRRDRDPNMIS